jgi:transcription initiation factor TFIIA large subunit
MQRAASGDFRELGRVEIDRMLHEQILAKAKSMEGGGLMVPLKEATRHSSASISRKAKGKQPAAFDGGDDDEEDDDDAINSDLDDPEDDRDDDDVDDEGLGNIMLCMYDKVQRVKNKWYVSTCFTPD